jgi:hypothetical protein
LISDQGEIATIIEFDSISDSATILSFSPINSDSSNLSTLELSRLYLQASIPSTLIPRAGSQIYAFLINNAEYPDQLQHSNSPTIVTFETTLKRKGVVTKKKYKPVAQKVKSIIAELPDRFRIVRHIIGDPLEHMLTLNPNPPPFTPTGRYTYEHHAAVKMKHDGFLWPAERDLMHHFMCQQNQAFAWEDSERGSFRPDFFPPIDIPIIPHTPFIEKNIPIPPGIYEEVCAVIRKKLAAGVYEPSNSSYRLRWFCVLKKVTNTLRLVHSLEPLNHITI